MRTVAEIIDAFGGTGGFAAALGISQSHARVMKCRNSIATRHWAALVDAASNRRIGGITFEALARLTASSPTKERKVA